MRRTNMDLQTTAIRNEDRPQTGKRGRRILFMMVLLFVLAGVSGIAGFMCVVLPQQNAMQIDENCVSSLRKANAGDSVFLGAYEQDNDLSDGAEPIEWIVLSKQDDRALLVSKYALDYAPFNTGSAISTWDYSTIMQWLNESFFTTAFSSAEQTMVSLSKISAGSNTFFGTDPGRVTGSRVFLLSLAEANTFFQTSDERQCRPTAYAAARGVSVEENGGCGWWLRSPGYDDTAASRVLPDGSFSFIGQPAERSLAVRPAMWVEISEIENA